MTAAIDPRLSLLDVESPGSARLAELASFAVRVDTGLLRRLRQRLLPDADVGAESDLWFSAIVESRSETGFQIAPEVAAQLRERLVSLPGRPAIALVRAAVREAHANVSPAIRLEEEISGIALELGDAGRPAIDEALRPALAALARGGSDAIDVARWAVHAIPRLHPIVRDTSNGRTLVLSASLLMRRRPRFSDAIPEPNVRIASLGWAVRRTDSSQRVGVEFVPGGLQFRAPSDDVGFIDVPITEPVLVEVEWESGSGPRSRLEQAAEGVLVALDGNPQAVTITTLLGDQFRVTASLTSGQAARWGAVSPPPSLLGACVQLEPLGHPEPMCVAFAVDSSLLLSVSDIVASYPILGVSGDDRQVEVIRWSEDEAAAHWLAPLRLIPVPRVQAVMSVTLPAADPRDNEPDRVVAAGVVGGVARWYDVALEHPTATFGELRRGVLFDSPELSEQELKAAFVGAPLVVDNQAVGVIVRAAPPQRRDTYASIEAVTAAYVRDVVERARRATAPNEDMNNEARESFKRIGVTSADNVTVAIVIEAARMAPEPGFDEAISWSRIFYGALLVGTRLPPHVPSSGRVHALAQVAETAKWKKIIGNNLERFRYEPDNTFKRLRLGFSHNGREGLKTAFEKYSSGDQLTGDGVVSALLKPTHDYQQSLLYTWIPDISDFNRDVERQYVKTKDVITRGEEKIDVKVSVERGAGTKAARQQGRAMTTEQDLIDLNVKIAEMERRRDMDAENFFREVLSDELIFRRSSGAIRGKIGFLDGLKGPYPFTDLKAEDIEVGRVDGLESRALITLIVVGRRADGTEEHYRNIRLFSKADESQWKWRLEFWYNYELTSM